MDFNEIARKLFGRFVYGGSTDTDFRVKAQAEVVKQFGANALAVDGKALPAEMATLLSKIAGDTRKQTLDEVEKVLLTVLDDNAGDAPRALRSRETLRQVLGILRNIFPKFAWIDLGDRKAQPDESLPTSRVDERIKALLQVSNLLKIHMNTAEASCHDAIDDGNNIAQAYNNGAYHVAATMLTIINTMINDAKSADGQIAAVLMMAESNSAQSGITLTPPSIAVPRSSGAVSQRSIDERNKATQSNGAFSIAPPK